MTKPSQTVVPPVERTFGSAHVRVRSDRLEISTGVITRTWQWTGRGWATVALRDEPGNRDWITRPATPACD